MSQSKVDQRKYEKKHRKEILRKQKIKKVVAVTVTIVGIAAIVGSIAGVKIYKAIPKYVEASGLNSYIDKAYSESGYDSLFPATSTDAEEDGADSEESTDATSESDSSTDTDTSEDTAAETDSSEQ